MPAPLPIRADRDATVWFADEARVGRKGRTTRVWYQKGVRPRGVREHRFASVRLWTCSLGVEG